MKKSLCNIILVSGTAFTLFGCQKVNSVSDEEASNKKNPRKDLCLVGSFGYSNSNIPSTSIFSNHFDLSGRSIDVDAGVFSGGSILSNMQFTVKWTNQGLAFLDANAPQDTILFASFSKKGRIEQIIPGNHPNAQFLPTSFEYEKGRLHAINISLAGKTETSYFDYDQKGNLLTISDVATPSVTIPGKVEYGYATNEKANEQFYLDEPRKFSWNSFSLLQYIGLFPELQPVNLRTSTKVTWGNNYVAYNMNIVNQQLDQDGKLVSYDIASPGSNATISHYNINWTCNGSQNVVIQGNQ